MAPRALLGGPNFLAGLHLLSSLLLGAASAAWRWASERLVPLEGARAARRSRSRGRYSWGEERVACAHGELSLGGMSEAGPGQGAALSRACGRAAANANKNPNWLFEAQNHAKTADCVLERRREAALEVYGAINLVFLGQFCAFHVASETRPPEPHRSNRDDCAAPRTSSSRTETPVTLRRPPATPKQLLPRALAVAVEQIIRR